MFRVKIEYLLFYAKTRASPGLLVFNGIDFHTSPARRQFSQARNRALPPFIRSHRSGSSGRRPLTAEIRSSNPLRAIITKTPVESGFLVFRGVLSGAVPSLSKGEGKQWTLRMKDFLLEAKGAVDLAKSLGKTSLDDARIKDLEKRCEEILREGYDEYPQQEKPGTGKRRKRKRAPSLNLLNRLWYGMDNVLAFLRDFRVPFDNNLSERDIRMMKVHQKISGIFRSNRGADWFCRIRSYISTVRKNGLNVLAAVRDAFMGRPYMPGFT